MGNAGTAAGAMQETVAGQDHRKQGTIAADAQRCGRGFTLGAELWATVSGRVRGHFNVARASTPGTLAPL